MTIEAYQGATDQWVQSVVIDLGLCPFAWKSIQENRLSFRVVIEKEEDIILQNFMEEIYLLENNPELESSLVTLPHAYPEFAEFLEALEKAKELLTTSGFEGVYQIASFHPQFQFGGTTFESPENYTNRSPYPIWHPIRESAMSEAIDSYPEINEVGERNIKKMNSLGLSHVQELLKNCYPK